MEVLKTRGFSKNFWSFRDNGGKVFQGWQNSNRCPRVQFMKIFFKREKFALFSDCERMFTSSESFCQSCENRNLCIGGSFWGKTIFEIYIFFHTFFRLWSQKRLVGKKIFPGLPQLQFQRHFLRKSTFFKKKFYSFISSGVWAIFLVFWQKIVRLSKKQPTNTEKSWTKRFVEKLFSLNHFRISSRKVWTIRQKKLAGLSKLHSKSSEEHF